MVSSDDVTATALKLEAASVIRFIRAISSRKPDASVLRIFQHQNGIHSVHGSDNVALAARLNLDDRRAVSQLNPPSDSSMHPVDTLTFTSKAAKELAAAALFSTGKKVELFSVGNDGRPSMVASGSPGNVDSLEEFLGEADLAAGAGGADQMNAGTEDCTILAVKISDKGGSRVLGICSWDVASRRLGFGQVNEDDMFSELEGIVVATHAKEAIFCEGDIAEFDSLKIDDVFDKCGVAKTTQPKMAFSASAVPEYLENLVGNKASVAAYLDLPLACEACAALLSFTGLSSDDYMAGKVVPSDLANHSVLQMDNAALRALNVLPIPGDSSKKASIFGLFNIAKTAMGTRLLRRWLTQPLQDVDAINERLEIVECFMRNQDLCRDIRDQQLNRISDMNVLCRKFIKQNGKKASLRDVVRLYQCIACVPAMVTVLKSGADMLKARFADPLVALYKDLENFEALVETALDMEQIENGEFVISPNISPKLKELRGKQDKILVDIAGEHRSVSGNFSDVKIERKDKVGHVFRITRKFEKQIRGKNQYTVLETRKDGIRFQTRALARLSEKYKDVSADYAETETEHREQALSVAATYVEIFVSIAALLGELDVLSSFAFMALGARSDYCRPTIVPAGEGLVLKQARHPIVEENMDDAGAFIANDIDMRAGREADTGGALLLVTGPNMGGKSTYIRTAGVVTLLAHIGAFVPAREARVPLTDRILARVGAGDNQHRAISTFMAEMLETASILRAATSKSLVLIDELGRGTGTMDGFGLAHAISSHIATKIKASCLFATHFYELTALADKIESVRNFHVTASVNERTNHLTFLYEVQEGACDKSFGVHVAEMAHFPASVVAAAKRKAAELESNNNPVKKLKISKEEVEAGQALVSSFLADLKKLPMKSSDVSLAEAKKLRDAIVAEKNAYVQALLAE